jgi:predicted homoserine dehydrogenase-like protein
MGEETIGLGVVGCGGFGLCAPARFAQVPGVQLTGMAGTHRQAAQAAAERFANGRVSLALAIEASRMAHAAAANR